jgi:hypothetical protein
VAAAIPGLISYADPHRLASFYPAVCAVAGCVAAAGLGAFRAWAPRFGAMAASVFCLVALPLALARSGALYFDRPEGEPPTQTIVRAIHERATPGTLLVLDLPDGLPSDAPYLLFDASLSEPFGWMVLDENKWRDQIRDFRPRFDNLFHVESRLRYRIPELQSTQWKRFVFVISQDLDPPAKLAALREKFGSVEVEEVLPPTWRGAEERTLTFATVTPRSG